MLLTRDRNDLTTRIQRRTSSLLDEDGLGEVRAAQSGSVSHTAAGIIGLADIGALLTGEISRAECLGRIKNATRQYAKRQMTWFRRQSFEQTVHLTDDADTETLIETLAARIEDGSR